jgi:hydrogenase-4 component B
MIAELLLTSIVLTLVSGVPGLFTRSAYTQRIATLLHSAGCAAGLVSAIFALVQEGFRFQLSWTVPGGWIAFRFDSLSAFFLIPFFIVLCLGSIYGEHYWPHAAHPVSGRKLRLFYGSLSAGLALVTIAGDAWTFLFGWEITGLSAFFLVTTESNEEALRAGWIYLIATHVSTLVLFAMFGVMHSATGSWMLDARIDAGSPLVTPILLLAFAGFAIKAGLMPFHIWLPEAHAAAPSHVSAILSGIVLKIGIYGLIRILLFVPVENWFGLMLLLAGIVSGILGVVFALVQHDLKRLLAYHSIENIGIIFIGLGAAILGKNESWGALAFAGAVLHVWNHAFFKALLFFAAGSVVQATGTRSIDLLGGLLRSMPITAISFLTGAVAICGLPPLNGFVSEWLIYIAGFKATAPGVGSATVAILAVPALALIGALAIACFVKAFSVVFLGNARSAQAMVTPGHKPAMVASMAILILICVLIGVWPPIVSGVLSQVTAFAFANQSAQQVPSFLQVLSIASILTLSLIVLVLTAIAYSFRRISKSVTWDCGYGAPTSRMQYTASSFAQPLGALFQWTLRTEVHRPANLSLFPSESSFSSHVPDPVLDRILVPAISKARRFMTSLYFIQSGHIQVYIVYVIVTLLILLTWSAL